jgi:hypothetical protein
MTAQLKSNGNYVAVCLIQKLSLFIIGMKRIERMPHVSQSDFHAEGAVPLSLQTTQ